MRELVVSAMDSRLLDMLDLWRDGGGGDPLAHFAGHAEHLLIIEPAEGGNRYAHYGAAFTRHFGMDLTGRIIDVLPADILPAQRRGMLEFEYAYARRANLPLWRAYTAPFPNGRTETWQRLVLPLGGGILAVGAYPVEPSEGEPGESRLLRLVIERAPVVLNADGSISDLALSLQAFCEAQLQVAELEVLASRDPLTGVNNLRQFHHLAGLELEHARRMGRSFALLALDIDHFKVVNDTHGHAAGDHALRAFAGACRLALREYDILGRVGGEEFAVALPNTSLDGARLIAERLRRQVQDLVIHPGKGCIFTITVSVGVTGRSFAEGADGDVGAPDVAELLAHADRALYRAKETGRNRVVTSDRL